ncbi:MAG TPA: hypothetical protein VNP93_06860 [Gaiellaceae bacterium]|nr:hypothetical protein [Gaiellaceae bacterium]
MKLSRITSHARLLVCLVAGALLADLFLDWRRVAVDIPGVSVDTGTTAVAGWGAVAAVALIALLSAEVMRPRPDISTGLALFGAAFVVVEFFTGSANVDVAGVLSVDPTERAWPAYVGLVLAGCLVTVATLRLLESRRTHAPGAHVTHGTA